MPESSFLVGIDVEIHLAGLHHLQVTAFSAHEEIGEPFHVDLTVETEQGHSAIDLKTALGVRTSVTLEQEHKEFGFAGIIRKIEHLGCTPLLSQLYRILIVPPVALLDQGRRCRAVPQHVDDPDVFTKIFNEEGIKKVGTSFNASYAMRPHVLQYQESDLDFIDRLMEQEGMYSFYSFDERGEGSLTIADNADAHPDPDLKISALNDLISDGEVIGPSFSQSIPAKSFSVMDYDAQHPANPFDEKVDIGKGATRAAVGARADYDQQVPLSQGDAKRYAQVRMEQAQCAQMTATASSTVFRVHAGYLITLADHPVDDFNGKYLVLCVEHEVSEQGYRNRLTLIPQKLLPYRPPMATPVPEIPGYLLGKVTAVAGAQNGEEVDGAYAVQLMFEEESATRVVRMAQPYGGSDRGMHFPLAMGTEVLLGHLNGDPDRPYIIGALPNSEAPSVVVDENKTQSVIKSSANSTLVFEDDKNKQAVTLASGGGHQMLFSDDQEHAKIKINTNGGSQLLMDDTKDASLVDLMTLGGHQVKLDDAKAAPKILVKTTGAHALTLDDTTSAPKVSIETAQNHVLILDGSPGSTAITIKTGGGHQLVLSDTPTPVITLKSSGGQSLKLDDTKPVIALDTTGDCTISAVMNVKISADIGIKLQCGASSISLDPAGNIKITGTNITINGSAQAQIQGGEISVQGEGPVAIKGAIIQLN